MKIYSTDTITKLQLAVMDELVRATPECRRGMKITELHPVLMRLTDPTHRVFMTPKRNANIFALIAETLWVLSGRDDLSFLSFYLPRAEEYSDDGTTWRAAYGPRLRGWSGVSGNTFQGSTMRYVDQLQMMLGGLRQDADTRRAVAVIHDPAKDFVETKDRACNNWLHFMRSGGRLDLEVVSRSTDMLWGSMINLFEWSVLQEIMSYWAKQPIGDLYFYTSSCHMYEQFRSRFQDILYNQESFNIYDHVSPVKFDLCRDPKETYEYIDALLKLEETMRENPRNAHIGSMLYDLSGSVWLSAWGSMLWAYCAMNKEYYELASRILRDMPRSDLQVAGWEYLRRVWKKSNKSCDKLLSRTFHNNYMVIDVDKKGKRRWKEGPVFDFLKKF